LHQRASKLQKGALKVPVVAIKISVATVEHKTFEDIESNTRKLVKAFVTATPRRRRRPLERVEYFEQMIVSRFDFEATEE